MLARRRQLTQMAEDRQQLSDSLSNLQTNLRDTAREMASNQPGVAENLRDALKEMDNSDLDNRVQRSADWLRSGINPNSNGTEDQIAQGLAKLSQQLQQAQKGMGQAGQGERRGTEQDQAALVDQVERLRNQMESMTRSLGGRGQAGQNGQPAQGVQGGQDGQQRFSEGSRLSRNGEQSGQAGGQDLQSRGPDNGQGQNGRQRGQSQQAQSGSNGGGGAVDGTVWNNINTGNNRYGQPRQQSASSGDSFNFADSEDSYRRSMRELNQLRQMVTDDPQAAKDIAELTRQMQHLDPSRFRGNPAMVEQMHRELLSSVNQLELQLQHDGVSPQARTGNPSDIPAGYQASVADYYRRLSKNP
jgi:hypothetical protein